MKIIRAIKGINCPNTSVITLGSYDGLHIGHLKILKKAIFHSKTFKCPTLLITYEPHPKKVLDPNTREGFLLSSFEEKMKIIEQTGIDYVFIISFDKKFSKLSAEDFMGSIIKESINPKAIVVGKNHHFGFNRSGNSDFLLKYCNDNQIKLDIVNPVKNNTKIVSSTHIRELIKMGNVNCVKPFLGRFYSFSGTIIKGSGRGTGDGSVKNF